MLSGINPQLPYYVMLFVLTIILRLIRAYRSRPTNEDDLESKKEYIARYFYFGFELVNVSAGVFILLSEYATKYVGTVMMLYVILVILSFFFEDDGVGRILKITGHMVVSLVVVGVTFYAFLAVDGLNSTTTQNWRVAFPYIDTTLNRNFGVKATPIQSVFVVEVSAASRIEALNEARTTFFSEKGPSPFVAKVAKTPLTMVVIEGDAVVESVNSQELDKSAAQTEAVQ
jgi:hypothetical protein